MEPSQQLLPRVNARIVATASMYNVPKDDDIFEEVLQVDECINEILDPYFFILILLPMCRNKYCQDLFIRRSTHLYIFRLLRISIIGT